MIPYVRPVQSPAPFFPRLLAMLDEIDLRNSSLSSNGFAEPSDDLSGAGWRFRCANKMNFQQRGARLTAVDFHKDTGILVVAFTNGLFELYQVWRQHIIRSSSVNGSLPCSGMGIVSVTFRI